MAHTYASILVHCVFSTKERKRQINDDLHERLRPYIGGIARENGFTVLGVDGVDDHVHVLIDLPPRLSVSKAMQLIKGGSSKWVHDTFPASRDFAWQEGFGAFSIGISGRHETLEYIRNQRDHHQRRTFEEEYRAFLQRHGISIDEQYFLG